MMLDDLDFEREPHPLPQTREWFGNYRRWVAEGCPSPEEEAARRAVRNPVPDLQKVIEFAGRRYCASRGEEYVEDPFTRPAHQGGYQHITAEEWAEFDRATAEWQVRRRAR
jgi:hypothetical protein